MVHGINDNNVKPDHSASGGTGSAERACRARSGYQTGHVDPFDFRRAEWVNTLHRWFDYWLQGVTTGS